MYFYPRDFTPHCTQEACKWREKYDELNELDETDVSACGVTIVGISEDQPERHAKFKNKYNLPYTLLTDVEVTHLHADSSV